MPALIRKKASHVNASPPTPVQVQRYQTNSRKCRQTTPERKMRTSLYPQHDVPREASEVVDSKAMFVLIGN
jgi:hypothetical protein